MIIKLSYCTSCYAGTQPRVRLGVMPPPSLLPTLPLLPTAATRQVLPASIAPAVRPAAVPPTVPPAVIPAVPPAVAPVGTPAVLPALDPLLHLPRAPVATPQPLLPSTGVAVPGRNAAAASYHGASDGVCQSIPGPRGDAASAETLDQDYSPGIRGNSGTASRSLVTSRGDGAFWVLLLYRSQEEEATGDQYLYLAARICIAGEYHVNKVSRLRARVPGIYQSTIIKCYRDYDGLG